MQSSWHGHGSPGDASGTAHDALCCPRLRGLGSRSSNAGCSQGWTGQSSPDLASPLEQGRAHLASPHQTSSLQGSGRDRPHLTPPAHTGLVPPAPSQPLLAPRPLAGPRSARRPAAPGQRRSPGGSRGPRRPHLCPAGPPGLSRLAHPRVGRAPEAAARSRGGAPARAAHARQRSAAPPLGRARRRTWRHPTGLHAPRKVRPILRPESGGEEGLTVIDRDNTQWKISTGPRHPAMGAK